MVANKRGVATITLFVLIFTCLALMGVLGTGIWAATLVDESISSLEIQIGNQSFQETYNETLKLGITPFITTMPQIISMGVMLGLVILMMLVGHFSREIGRLWILLDIAFLIVAEIIASSVSAGFISFMNSDPVLLAIYSTTLSTPATFLINLPAIIPIIGILIMLATYIKVKKERGDVPSF